MEINEVFKKYPENEPSYNGTNYLTLVNIQGVICYDISYFNDDAEFEPSVGIVVAFTETEPFKILNAIN